MTRTMTVIGSRFSIPGAIESRRPARFLFGVASWMQISHVPCHLEASYQFRVARLPTCLQQSNAMSFVRGLEWYGFVLGTSRRAEHFINRKSSYVVQQRITKNKRQSLLSSRALLKMFPWPTSLKFNPWEWLCLPTAVSCLLLSNDLGSSPFWWQPQREMAQACLKLNSPDALFVRIARTISPFRTVLTSRPEISMSALPPKADIDERDCHVRYGP